MAKSKKKKSTKNKTTKKKKTVKKGKASKKVTKKQAKKKAIKKATKKATKRKTKKAAKKVTKKSAKKTTKKKITKKAAKKATNKKAPEKSASKSPSMVGKKIPALSLPTTGLGEIKLDELAGKKIVLYFYPKDATPGCTLEGRDFTQLHDEFKSMNTEVFGVSRDSMKSHEKFKEKENYSVDLISDPEEKLCRSLGVIKKKNLYGREYEGIERSTFVVDEEGKIVREWRGVKVPGHAQEVLEFVRKGRSS